MAFKPFADMSPADYEAVGFKSGLEIHQQLLTSRKLFCRCPAGRYSDTFNAEILRHMRPTLSELGEYDGTALMEFKTQKEIIYRINRETVCTYEMDDTPPFELNTEALDIALEVALLYGCSMVDEIHIARKQYLDGSIPTGFQRTTIVGVDGGVPFKGRRIGIVQVGLEEDSCREVSDIGHQRTYLTDRLGMPLIETVTEAAMRTPQEVAEAAELLRKIVRSTGKMRSGGGAARQDVNVSVTGGTRIEIKGVPKIPNIPLLTYNEAMRQWNLLRLRDELAKRGVTPATFQSASQDVTKLLRRTRFQPVREAIAQGAVVSSVLLRGYRGLLRWQTQTDTYFSREISDRVRVVACLTTLPNIIHSDSPSETLATSEWQTIRKTMAAGDEDTVVLTWGGARDVKTASNEIAIRAKEAAIGVPSETRQALRDGTNGFERILPGPDRMYPDTDLPPRRITREHLGAIRSRLPKPVWEVEERYRSLRVAEEDVTPLALSPLSALFEQAVAEWRVPPPLAAMVLRQYPKRVSRKLRRRVELPPELLGAVLKAHADGLLAREGILPALEAAANGTPFDSAALPPRAGTAEFDAMLRESVARVNGMKLHNPERFPRVLMGHLMQKLRGRMEGKAVVERLDRMTEEAWR